MFVPFSKLSQSHRMASAIAALALLAVGTALYLSPTGTRRGTADAALTPPPSGATTPSSGPTTARSSSTSTSSKTPPSSSGPGGGGGGGGGQYPYQPPATRTKTSTTWVPGPTTTRTHVVVNYIGPRVTVVHVPTKAALVHPKTKFFGLAEDGIPGDTKLFDSLSVKAGKAPDLVEWFSYWDDSYSSQKVVQSWQRGAMPFFTWQSAPHDFRNTATDISAYSMKNIAHGYFDKYLKSFAISVVNTGLPVGIRLDHEMNGNWYPWGAGYDKRGIHNTPAYYRAAWQHVWQVFDAVGANKYVIWSWTPSRTDTLTVDSQTGFTKGDTGLVEDYPGDKYVDWMGLSAYQFRPTQPATYDYIFGGTLNGNRVDVGLKTVSDKPIVIAEMGSAQVVGKDTDNTANKVAWTTATLAQVVSDPRIVGFVLFNNNVIGLHSIILVDGTHLTVDTNWKFDSSPAALAAFQRGISNAAIGSGLMPSEIKGTVRLQIDK